MTNPRTALVAVGALLLIGSIAGAAAATNTKANENAYEHASEHSALRTDHGHGGNQTADNSTEGAPDAPVDPKACGDYRNHGDYVSESAKEDGNASEAARSDVGKCGSDEPSADDDSGEESEDAPGRSDGRGGERGRSEEARDEHPPRE